MSSKESDHEAEPDEILKIEKIAKAGNSNRGASASHAAVTKATGTFLRKGRMALQKNKFGWGEAPAFMMAKVGKKGRAKWARINLGDVEENTEMEVPFGKLRFEVPSNAEDTILNFGLYELWTGGWKGGLLIHEAVVEEMPD
ncbi:PROTEIN PHLOEM PROTEIN 2-LIKE A9 [Salix purpurea]|uniref:PROTEIN PHLOEM PROTEIN 2-LIKE A9 n=1 Tax=Salix purpurea TaxID=77065 RepID=A0A9Q0VGV0_SALPP|nr:PROTEIN PHLOEM PROTEIN 2-LIKE A9 [Salix purpurea]